ncbi:uncharacterized protein LOC144642838 isoform X2 [Oculina patagonica]
MEVKITRLVYLLILVFIFRCFASTPNKSTKKVSANGTQQIQCEKPFLKKCCMCRDGKDGRDGRNGKDGHDGGDGKTGVKGQKGEPGLSGKQPHGAITDTADNCTMRTAGTVRYSNSQSSLQLCDESAWLSLVTAGKDHVANKQGRQCLDILKSGFCKRDTAKPV